MEWSVQVKHCGRSRFPKFEENNKERRKEELSLRTKIVERCLQHSPYYYMTLIFRNTHPLNSWIYHSRLSDMSGSLRRDRVSYSKNQLQHS